MPFYTPVALKLHAFGLQRLHDPNWTGMELFDELKRPVRREGFLQKFEKDGFLFWLGGLLFEHYMTRDSYVENLDGEYMVWYLGVSPGASKPATYGRFKTSHDMGWNRVFNLTLQRLSAWSKCQTAVGFLFRFSEPATERG